MKQLYVLICTQEVTGTSFVCHMHVTRNKKKELEIKTKNEEHKKSMKNSMKGAVNKQN